MPNHSGNMNIVELGKSTRFGSGNCPRAARRRGSTPWSIRNAVRAIAGFKFPGSSIEESPTVEELLQGFTDRGVKITVAHLIAATLWVRALEGNYSAIVKVTNLVDGRLKEVTATAGSSLEDLINGS